MDLPDVVNILFNVNIIFILTSLTYFTYQIYTKRSTLSKNVIKSSYLLIIAGISYALAEFFVEQWALLTIILITALLYLDFSLIKKEKIGLVMAVFSGILLVVYYYLFFTPYANTPIHIMTVIGAVIVATVISIILYVRQRSFVFFSIMGILVVRFFMGLIASMYPDLQFFISLFSLVVASFFVALYVSVFRRKYIAYTALFISMGLIGATTSIIVSILSGIPNATFYFAAEAFAIGTIGINVVYFLKDYEKNFSINSLLFASAFIIIIFLAMFDMLETLFYDVIEQLPPIIFYVDWALIVTATLSALFLTGALISLSGKNKILFLFSLFSASLITYVGTLTFLFPEEEFVVQMLFVVVSILLAIALLSLGYIVRKLLKFGARSAALRFTGYFVAVILYTVGEITYTMLTFIETGILILFSGLVFLLSSPVFITYIRGRIKREHD